MPADNNSLPRQTNHRPADSQESAPSGGRNLSAGSSQLGIGAIAPPQHGTARPQKTNAILDGVKPDLFARKIGPPSEGCAPTRLCRTTTGSNAKGDPLEWQLGR